MSRRRSKRDEPMPLGDAVAEVGRSLRIPEPDATARLLAAWPDIVGAEVARHVSVRSVRDAVLTVAADDPAWASEFRYLESAVRAALDARVGPGVVESLRVVVRPGR